MATTGFLRKPRGCGPRLKMAPLYTDVEAKIQSLLLLNICWWVTTAASGIWLLLSPVRNTGIFSLYRKT